MIARIITAAVWAAAGGAAGYGIRRGSVWLAKKEELEPGATAWQEWGPPITAAVLFAAFGAELGPHPILLLRSLWVAVFVQIIYFDFEYRLILDRVMFPSMAAAILLSLVTPHLGIVLAVLTGAGCGLLFLLLALLGALVFRVEALGFGDVKLAAFIGLVTGGLYALQALWYGVVLAGVLSILLVVTRIRGMRDSIAFGPYLAAGAVIVLFTLGLPGAK